VKIPRSRLEHIVEVVPSLVTTSRPQGWGTHPVWELLLVVRGVHRLEIGRAKERWSGGVGAVVVMPPETLHRGRNPLDRSTAILVVQWTGWSPFDRWTALRDEAGRLLTACRWLRSLPSLWEESCAAYREHLLGAILAECRRLRTDPADLVDPLDRLRRDMEGLHHAQLDVAQLAASVHLSPRHVNRLFKARFGVTPARYLQRFRVERAVHLLRGTTQPLREVARRVGFASPSHLCRLIRRYHGTGVRELRDRPAAATPPG
jgi:AraC-like DNA-binding protein